MKSKDVIILSKILDYCRQLDEACDMFDNDYNNFVQIWTVSQHGIPYSMISRN